MPVFCFWNLINPSFMKRIASNDPPDRQPSAFDHPKSLDRGVSVLRTGRVKTAVSVRIVEFHESMIKRQGLLIKSDHEKDNQRGENPESPLHTSFARLNMRSICSTSCLWVWVIVSFFTRNKTSNPGLISRRRFSTIPRILRLILFRTTARFEIFVPTTTVNLVTGRLFGAKRIPSVTSKTLLPFAKSVLISFSFRNLFTEGNTEFYLEVAFGARTFRPFARRRAITSRPFFVLIRLRNPCVLTRLSFFGWWVRFGIGEKGESRK